MIAMPLSHPRLSAPLNRTPSNRPASFQPLDPTVVNASIPTFFVGRSHDGFWLARDAGGRNGGVFLLKSSAMAFARRLSRPQGCAIVFLSERLELDVENRGNPIVGYLKPLLRLVNLLSKDTEQ